MNDLLNLKEFRKKMGLTQTQLANECGVTIRTVQNWENGGVIPEVARKLILQIKGNPEMVSPAVMTPLDGGNVKERVKKFIEHKKLPISKFEEMCDLSNGYISAMRKGFGQDKLNNVLSVFPELNREWLLYGEGEMLKVPATLSIYKPTTDERQEIGTNVNMKVVPAEVVEEIKDEIREEVIEEIKAEVIEEIKQEAAITVIPADVANQVDIDIKKYIEENESELEKMSPSDLTGDVDGVEKVRKNSMWPTFVPGDKVFIKFLKHKTHITDGGIYYFNLRTRPTMIRQVKIEGDKLRLIAFNSQYSDIITNFDNVLRVADINGMYRSFFSDQYSEVESVRRKKDGQIDRLLEQNQEALKIIGDLIQKR